MVHQLSPMRMHLWCSQMIGQKMTRVTASHRLKCLKIRIIWYPRFLPRIQVGSGAESLSPVVAKARRPERRTSAIERSDETSYHCTPTRPLIPPLREPHVSAILIPPPRLRIKLRCRFKWVCPLRGKECMSRSWMEPPRSLLVLPFP